MCECDQFKGRMREICRGEADGMSDEKVNKYRKLWNLPPLGMSQEEWNATRSPSRQKLASVQPLPPLLIRGWNFATAMWRWTSAGFPMRTQQDIDTRLAICQGCEFFANNACSQCGCGCTEETRLINKLALSTEKCPVGKWQ